MAAIQARAAPAYPQNSASGTPCSARPRSPSLCSGWAGPRTRTSVSGPPLLAGVLFGYGVLCVFISCYQYVIDSYEMYAASALTSVTLVRYATAGGMTVVGMPFYRNMGVHWTLTVLGAIIAVLVPVPYLFYVYVKRIRGRSKVAFLHE